MSDRGAHRGSIQLRSGGRLSVVMTVNLFELSAPDQAFVLGLIDTMNGYTEMTAGDPTEQSPAEPPSPGRSTPHAIANATSPQK